MKQKKTANVTSKKEKKFVEQFLSYDEHMHWIGKNQKVNYLDNYLLQTYSIAVFALIVLGVLIYSFVSSKVNDVPYQLVFQIVIILFLVLLLSFAAYMFFYYTKLLKRELYVITNKRSFVVTNHYKAVNYIPHSTDLLIQVASEGKKQSNLLIGKNMKIMVETVSVGSVLGSLFSSRQLVQDKKVKVKNCKFYRITFRSIEEHEKVKNLLMNQCQVMEASKN